MSEAQNRLRDDPALDFVGAAEDRPRTTVEIALRRHLRVAMIDGGGRIGPIERAAGFERDAG